MRIDGIRHPDPAHYHRYALLTSTTLFTVIFWFQHIIDDDDDGVCQRVIMISTSLQQQ